MALEPLPKSQPEQSGGRVAKNASIYFFGQTLGWLANIVILSIIPRTLGEAVMGQFTYILGVMYLMWMCVMLGGEMYLVVEIGRDRAGAAHLVGALLGLRLVLMSVFVGVSLLFFSLAKGISAEMWRLIWILMSAGLLVLLSDPLRAVMVAWEDSKRVASLDLLFTLFPLLTLPFLRYGVITQAVIFFISSLTVLILRCRLVGRVISLRPRFDPALWKRMIAGGFPYQANNLILQVYSLTGIFMVKHFADYQAVGVYSQAQRLFGAFLFVPIALGSALLPSLARMAEVAGTDELRRTQSRVLVLLIVVSLPVTTAIMFLSTPISHFLYGATKFVDMPMVLRVYALAIAPMYIVTTMYQFLAAQKRGAIWTVFLAASIGLYVLFSSLLIPYTLRVYGSGATGGVAATVLAELCSAGFALALLGNNPFTGGTLRRIACAFLAAGGMAAALWFTRSIFPLVSLAFGVSVFALLAWRLRVLAPEEQHRVEALLQRLRRRRA